MLWQADGSVKMDWCGPNPRKCNVPPGGGNSANQTDRYIAKGGAAEEVFTPHFTYHGHPNWMFLLSTDAFFVFHKRGFIDRVSLRAAGGPALQADGGHAHRSFCPHERDEGRARDV